MILRRTIQCSCRCQKLWVMIFWMKALLDLAYLLKFIGDNEIFYYVPFMITLYTCCKRPAGISYSYIKFDCYNCPIFTVTPQIGVSARVAVSWLLQLLFILSWVQNIHPCLSVWSKEGRTTSTYFSLIAGSTDFLCHSEIIYYSRQLYFVTSCYFLRMEGAT